jgi:ribonucleoside-diphosphate reductase beta chain
MAITHIQKREGTLQSYNSKKISAAIYAAMEAVKADENALSVISGEKDGTKADADKIALHVEKLLNKIYKNTPPTVENVQDVVEEAIMFSDFPTVAKAYILYREKRNQERRRDIFKKRTNLKPYEYPELAEYVNAVRHSYWIHTEFNFTSDIQDFKVNINDSERNAIKNTMLAIAQIEVSVKSFWGDIFKKLPKPEIGAVGYTFAESEVRHHDAYSHLIEILGLNKEFETVTEVPVLAERIRFLEKALVNARSEDIQEYSQAILLFSLFIEHVSLFSQFLIIMSFNKHRDVFKGISNAVEATSKEEQIHGLFGIDVINIIREEHPDWFDLELEEKVMRLSKEAFEAESAVIDWIFEKGELSFLPKAVVKEFIKKRLNSSLEAIGFDKQFDVNEKLVEQTDWFDDEIIGTKHGDFFVKRSINYNKRSKSITSDDLF